MMLRHVLIMETRVIDLDSKQCAFDCSINASGITTPQQAIEAGWQLMAPALWDEDLDTYRWWFTREALSPETVAFSKAKAEAVEKMRLESAEGLRKMRERWEKLGEPHPRHVWHLGELGRAACGFIGVDEGLTTVAERANCPACLAVGS